MASIAGTTRGGATAPPEQAYGGVIRALHWLVLALVVMQFAVAWTMPEIHRDTQPVGLVAWHLSIGTVILLAMLGRLAWRLTHPGDVPPPPADIPAWQRQGSRVNHWLLYALLIVLPFLGWANASSRGWPVALFGVIPLPPLSAQGSWLGHELGDVHATLAWALLALAALHIAAALYHQLVLKDGLIRRMLG